MYNSGVMNITANLDVFQRSTVMLCPRIGPMMYAKTVQEGAMLISSRQSQRGESRMATYSGRVTIAHNILCWLQEIGALSPETPVRRRIGESLGA